MENIGSIPPRSASDKLLRVRVALHALTVAVEAAALAARAEHDDRFAPIWRERARGVGARMAELVLLLEDDGAFKPAERGDVRMVRDALASLGSAYDDFAATSAEERRIAADALLRTVDDVHARCVVGPGASGAIGA